ncbi:N-acyl amino acid synthase of PEP-CTERM/exosortase system [Modicisalibacter xianhensis]|uniref:N-acyl amino acid synthase of PEP-CTERM/exosortase system n=2 Tax=Modicisalibacter xianhensis TaxID=442341 RepID=A0A4R8G869_9GAMM|nr:N-acyl amino acid synthase of PEP-CTERM/exosortase system [Halomonas xianhensis]
MRIDSSSCPQGSESSLTVYEQFIRDFRFRLADDDETKRRVYALRYEIYCEELCYEEPAERFDKVEKDEYDTRSLHCLIEHRQSGKAAGCMRLVLPDQRTSQVSGRLPIQSHGSQSLNHATLHPERLPDENICEVSRLAISRDFRKARHTETLAQNALRFSEQEIRCFPLILIGLFLATYALVGLTHRPHVFAMMEPRLAKLLSRSGFNFTKVGETIEFHGKRSAYYINQRNAEEEMNAELVPLYLYVQQQLGPQLKAAQARGYPALEPGTV